MTNPEDELFCELCGLFGFKDGAEVTADGSMDNDLACDNAADMVELIRSMAQLLTQLRKAPREVQEYVWHRLQDQAALESPALLTSLEQMHAGEATEV
jgi:hypothetical protein